MTTNKPEVVAWIWDYRGRHMATTDYSQALELAEPPYPTEVEPLIRLADYQRLQADHERLQAELELWKAKIDAMAEHEVAAYQLIGIPASVGISEPVEGFARRPQDIMPAVRDMALRIELLESQLAESEALLAESRANDRQAMAYLAAVREVVGGDGFPEMAERVEALQAECDRLQAEYEQLISYTKNGIECFASPCPEHSGINTPPFSEFQERYGRLCLMCVVDERDTLRAENDELRQALNRMTAGLDNTIRHSQNLCAVTEEPGEAQSDAGHLLKKLEASHD